MARIASTVVQSRPNPLQGIRIRSARSPSNSRAIISARRTVIAGCQVMQPLHRTCWLRQSRRWRRRSIRSAPSFASRTASARLSPVPALVHRAPCWRLFSGGAESLPEALGAQFAPPLRWRAATGPGESCRKVDFGARAVPAKFVVGLGMPDHALVARCPKMCACIV